MNTPTFTTGDVAYLEDGQVVEFCAKVGDGYIVRPCYGEEDEEPWHGEPITVRQIFTSAPVARHHEEVAGLVAEAGRLREQISGRRRELQDIDRDIRDRQQRLKEHGVLELLDLWLAGKITHVLTISYGDNLQILSLEAAAKRDAHRSYSELSLLTLKGKFAKPGEIVWSFEGRFEGLVPFTSREAALESARQHIETRAEMRRKGRTDVNWGALYDSCCAIGIEAPADIAAEARAHALQQARKNAESARARLAVEEAALAQLETAAPVADGAAA